MKKQDQLNIIKQSDNESREELDIQELRIAELEQNQQKISKLYTILIVLLASLTVLGIIIKYKA
ncbi:hypothetical protein CD110_00760 [Staphylococcus casei]|uniref:hypothetical protein n=1 Tax=Staphylococcus TaxID=1279 RepID=UPI000CD2921C|nr:hypothetical protein [Staphylococcus casei]PNZ62753.1 hypothetical protein CD110_00760 [Staphylococcus casei]PTI73401.1 hypothetical protein BU064_13780 [Staphylococcus succinus]WJE86382.1 hypothetical protein QMO72_13480 [Staphylococcus casei]